MIDNGEGMPEDPNQDVYDALHVQWRLYRRHHPAGAYLPVGQMDGDCSGPECPGAWPCEHVRSHLEDVLSKVRLSVSENALEALVQAVEANPDLQREGIIALAEQSITHLRHLNSAITPEGD